MTAHIKSSLLLGIFLTLGAYFFFALSSILVKELHSLPTMEIIFFQGFIPLILFLILNKTSFKQLKPISWKAHLVRDLGGIASFFAYFEAIKYIDLVDATVLSYTAPFYIPFVWRIWAKEKINHEIWWAIFLGFIGILIILKPGTSIFKFSSFLGIISGIFSSLSLSAISVLHKKKETVNNILFYYFLLSALAALPFMYSWAHPSLKEWFFLLGIGLTSYFAQIFLTSAYKHGTASYLSPLSYSIVVFTALFSWIFFNKVPGFFSLIGIILIIVGGTLTYLLKKKPANLPEVFEAEEKRKWKFWKKR